MTPKEINRAYEFFEVQYDYRKYDLTVRPFLDLRIQSYEGEWIRKVRHAYYLSAKEMAVKLDCGVASYYDLEKSELKGRISLQRLREVAAKLDCELVYALRPKSRKVFSREVWDRQFHWCLDHPHLLIAHDFQNNKEKTLAKLVGRWLRRKRRRISTGDGASRALLPKPASSAR